MPAALRLSPAHYRLMLQHVQNSLPNEACGMVAGRNDRAEAVFPVDNILNSPARFQMDPVEQLKVLLWIDEQQMQLLAIYHSHPLGPPHPSQTDLDEYAYPDSIALIWWREQGSWQVRGFQIREGGYIEAPLEWTEET